MGLTVGDLDAKIRLSGQAAFNSEMDSAGLKFGGLAKIGAIAMLAIGVAIIGGLALATRAAANYHSQLTQLVTGAGESQKNIAMVGNGMLAMAGKVGQSASALADGMFMIESAGFHGAAGLVVLEASAMGAKVGNAGLAIVANAVTTVLSDYHMAASKATDATNFLVAVVSQGKTHMEDLAQSLAMVLPFASALHVPLDQIGGAMATMTAKGIPAANAATYLRFTMAALANETPKGTKALESIGLTSSQVATELTTKGLLPALQLINEHLAVKFPKGGAAAFGALANIVGGTRGLGAALQLTGMNLKDFMAKTASVSNAIKGGHGAVIGWSTVQKDLNFQIDSGKAAFGAMGIQLGTKLLPPLTALMGQVIPLVPKIGELGSAFLDKVVPGVEQFAGWLESLGPDLKKGYDIFTKMAPFILAIAAAWTIWNVALAVTAAWQAVIGGATFVVQLLQIVSKVGLVTAAQWLWNIAMSANPIGVIVILIAGLVAILIYAYTHNARFRDIINAVAGAFKAFASQFWTDVKPVFDWLMPILQHAWDMLGKVAGAVGGVFSSIGNFVGGSSSGTGKKAGAYDSGGIFKSGHGPQTIQVAEKRTEMVGALDDVFPMMIAAFKASGTSGGGGGGGDTNALLAKLIAVVTAKPSGQTGTEAALYKAMQGAGMNRLRGMAGA